MTKFTIKELAYAKGTSELVRVAMLAMEEKLNAPWVSLTPEELLDLFDAHGVYGSKWLEFARAVEAKLKEKNHD